MKRQIVPVTLFACLCLLICGCKPEPVACFTVSMDGAILQADAQCSSNGEIYKWDFGDLGEGTGMQVTHQYEVHGDYPVTLTIENARGVEISTSTQVITVKEYCVICECVSDQGSSGGIVMKGFCGVKQQYGELCSQCRTGFYRNCSCMGY